MTSTIVQFSPLPSLTHPSFWHKLTELKLDVLKLSDAGVDITATYRVGRLIEDRESSPGTFVGVGGSLGVEDESFGRERASISFGSAVAKGVVKNYNTIEEFKAADKSKLFNEAADKIWQSIQTTGSTELLNYFLLITFADLKKYKYYYWFAFPALTSTPAWHIDENLGWVAAGTLAESSLSSDQMQLIYQQLHSSEKRFSYFLVRLSGPNGAQVVPVEEYDPQIDSTIETTLIGFIDPSAQPQNPGWPLRNLLAYLRALHPKSTSRLRIVAWRDAELPRGDQMWKSRIGTIHVPSPESTSGAVTRPGAVGWEKNVQGKLGPRMADLAPMMDPVRLANQAVDLNLKLMRWRILPELNLEKIAETRCLLLGAGTLGCYVARCLMGWGVRTITLVDSSKVSFSNPVRQPLFRFEDCLNGGKPKAECAAERLKEVWPGINATGHTLSIPMPGHPIPASPSLLEQAKKDVAKLEELIESHDAVYLLMDSRESRWLPTVIARAKGKLVLNAALGFDTFLVMRHGARPEQGSTVERDQLGGSKKHLGCYYCNDIVAPSDSLTDRTLDQMCTVTRPGLASMAASSAVELMMSVLQHPLGIHAPAPRPTGDNQFEEDGEGSSVLGLVPHQLRGYLAQFRNLHIVGSAYDRCTGCSETVLKAYENQGFEMMLNAFNDPKYLERLTGLDKLYEDGEKALEDVEWMEGEDEDGDDF